ncbi:hypothetical protein [Desulfosporosinus sp. HMP52]|uniref:hypothetical protein n=1 Tax=Desulfosporosinus sp. HMP52 TaxID=1487923 RepID=UPI000FFE46A4|nr:hypothetical protein [Desulfosporosinus sp. HMP52]
MITNDLEADIIIYISGCSANCSERYTKCDKTSVVIAGTTVNAITVSERQLSSVVIEKITELLE